MIADVRSPRPSARLGAHAVVLDLHERMPEVSSVKFGVSMSHPVVRLLVAAEQASIRFADRAITCTEQMRAAFVARGARPEKLTVVLQLERRGRLRRRAAAGERRDGGFTLDSARRDRASYGTTRWFAPPRCCATNCWACAWNYADGTYRDELREPAGELGLNGSVWMSDGWAPIEQLVLPSRPPTPVCRDAARRFATATHCNQMFDFVAMGRPAIVSRSARSRRTSARMRRALQSATRTTTRARSRAARRSALGPRLRRRATAASEPYRWEHQRRVYTGVIEAFVIGAAVASLAAVNGYLLGLLGAATQARAAPAPAAPRVALAVVDPSPRRGGHHRLHVAALPGWTIRAELVEVIVVADDCSDGTATVGARAGATVWSATTAAAVGGDARLAFARLPDVDAVVVVDADCTVSPNLLERVEGAGVHAGHERRAGRLPRRESGGLGGCRAALRELRALRQPRCGRSARRGSALGRAAGPGHGLRHQFFAASRGRRARWPRTRPAPPAGGRRRARRVGAEARVVLRRCRRRYSPPQAAAAASVARVGSRSRTPDPHLEPAAPARRAAACDPPAARRVRAAGRPGVAAARRQPGGRAARACARPAAARVADGNLAVQARSWPAAVLFRPRADVGVALAGRRPGARTCGSSRCCAAVGGSRPTQLGAAPR